MLLLPIGTDARLRRQPTGNYALIAINVAAFFLADVMQVPFVQAALPPLNGGVPAMAEYVTYQFRHGDPWHLLGNMMFLWIFGNAVCDRMGSLPYVIFYLAGGVFAGVVFAAFNENSMVGASGAIAAVTTAFLAMFPRVHVTMLLWLLFLVTTIKVPSLFLIVFKIILWDNVLAPSLERGVMSNVAYEAHLGGYAFGFVVSMLLLWTRALPRHQFDLLALWDRQRRRGAVAPHYAGHVGARPVVAEQTGSRPLSTLTLSPTERLRSTVLDRLASGDMEAAATAYLELIRQDPGHVLPRGSQLEMANYLAQTERHEEALQAYEAFLDAYPGAADSAQVRLLAGLISSRYLRRFDKAVTHLRNALDGLTIESQRALALQELRDAQSQALG